jgi:hypothetical protein
VPEFHTSREIATLGLSLFVCGLGIGPMVSGWVMGLTLDTWLTITFL